MDLLSRKTIIMLLIIKTIFIHVLRNVLIKHDLFKNNNSIFTDFAKVHEIQF